MNTQVLAAQVLAKSAQSSEQSSAQQCIAAFTARASFEATRPTRGDIEALRAGIAPKTPIYVSAVPAHPLATQIDAAVSLAAAGYEPVPHIAARRFSSGAELDRHLGRLSDDAGVQRVLVIGGDIAAPAGPFFAAMEVIENGLLQSRGIVEAGIPPLPDTPPRLRPTTPAPPLSTT